MILVLDNGDKYQILDEKQKRKILSIFYNSLSVGNYLTYAVMSIKQFTLLKDLSLELNCKLKDVFIKLINDFNLGISFDCVLNLKDKITYNKKYIVRTFNINDYIKKRLLVIKKLFEFEKEHQVWSALLDFESK